MGQVLVGRRKEKKKRRSGDARHRWKTGNNDWKREERSGESWVSDWGAGVYTPREHGQEWGLSRSPRENTHEDQLEQLRLRDG